jgi:hypothetical protein
MTALLIPDLFCITVFAFRGHFRRTEIHKTVSFLHPEYRLSRVLGSVTNNNGFWIGWFYLLTPLLITIDYIAVANLPNSQITRTLSILVHVLHCTPSTFIFSCSLVLCPLIIPRYGLHGKRVSRVIKNECLLVRYLTTDILILLRAKLWNAFTETLRSNGHMRHNIVELKALFRTYETKLAVLHSWMHYW